MDRLGQLLARDEIRQLAERYALAVDGKDLDGLASLFVPEVDNGRYGPGHEGLKTFYDHSLRKFHCSMHLVGNHVIDFQGDQEATGIVYCRAHHHVVDPDHWFDVALAYWDTYEQVAGRWLFVRRRVKSWYRQDVGHPARSTDRRAPEVATSGPTRGHQMPEAFETFDDFWARAPRQRPDTGTAPST